MPEEVKQINISLALIELKCDRFKLLSDEKSDIPFDKYEYVFTINCKVDEVLKKATVNLNIKLLDNRDKKELAELEAHTVFYIANFDNIATVFNDGRPTEYPVKLIEICNDITYQSVRGIFAVKLENSTFNNAILPLALSQSLLPVEFRR